MDTVGAVRVEQISERAADKNRPRQKRKTSSPAQHWHGRRVASIAAVRVFVSPLSLYPNSGMAQVVVQLLQKTLPQYLQWPLLPPPNMENLHSHFMQCVAALSGSHVSL